MNPEEEYQIFYKNICCESIGDIVSLKIYPQVCFLAILILFQIQSGVGSSFHSLDSLFRKVWCVIQSIYGCVFSLGRKEVLWRWSNSTKLQYLNLEATGHRVQDYCKIIMKNILYIHLYLYKYFFLKSSYVVVYILLFKFNIS